MDLLAAMRVYVRVVERGNMSAAARDLGLGQPAVSERIDRLEKKLGTRLLHRNTHSITPTDPGLIFYERSKHTLQIADDSIAAIGRNNQLRGALRIAAPHGFGEIVLPVVLAQLRNEHPELKIEMVLNDRIVDPVTEGVDVSLRLGNLGEGQFAARTLGAVQRRLVAAPDYIARHGRPNTPADLARHPFARVRGLFNTCKLPLLTATGNKVEARIDIAFTMSHWRPVHGLLLSGAGIGVLQAPVCEKDLREGRLVRLLPDYTVPAFDLHAIYIEARPPPRRVQLFLALLEQQLPAVLAQSASV